MKPLPQPPAQCGCPVHCCVCLQGARFHVPADGLVTGSDGLTYAVCAEHVGADLPPTRRKPKAV